MNIVFFGTPEFAVPSLSKLSETHCIVAVFTQPDKPRGRGHKLTSSPVKEFAVGKGYDVYQPEKIRDFDLANFLKNKNVDVAVVVAYGQKIPKEALDCPKHSFINVHASLLPAYRGAAPIERAIIDGLDVTGVSIMYMAEGMDTGDVGITSETHIPAFMNGGELTEVLSKIGADVLLEFLNLLENGKAPRHKQDDSFATYARKIDQGDLNLNLNDDARTFVNKVRAFTPKTGVKIRVKNVNIKVFDATLNENEGAKRMGEASSGIVVTVSCNGELYLDFGGELVKLKCVQPESKGRMSGEEFVRGYMIETGDIVESLLTT